MVAAEPAGCAGGVEVIEHDDDADGVSFKCVDPDGHRIEVYWEA